MKTVLVYYSYSGNTHRIARLMTEVLKGKGADVTSVRIRPLKEDTNFLIQCREAFLGKKPELYRTLLDLKDYDRIILGSPVWAFKPVPAINTYIEACSSLKDKEVFCFVTYGSGAGKDNTLEHMKKCLEKKGAKVAETLSFQQNENDEEVKSKILKVI